MLVDRGLIFGGLIFGILRYITMIDSLNGLRLISLQNDNLEREYLGETSKDTYKRQNAR